MSVTRLLCPKCGVPQCYCKCRPSGTKHPVDVVMLLKPNEYILERMKIGNPGLYEAVAASVEAGYSTDFEILSLACEEGATGLQMELIQKSIDALRVEKLLRAIAP